MNHSAGDVVVEACLEYDRMIGHSTEITTQALLLFLNRPNLNSDKEQMLIDIRVITDFLSSRQEVDAGMIKKIILEKNLIASLENYIESHPDTSHIVGPRAEKLKIILNRLN